MIRIDKYIVVVLLFVICTFSAYSQTCTGLTMKVKVLKGAACSQSNERLEGGTVELQLSSAIDHSTTVFRVITVSGVRTTEPGGLIIKDIPAATDLKITSLDVIPCLGDKISAVFDMSYGLHLDPGKTMAGICVGNATAQIVTEAAGGTGNYLYELLFGGTVVASNTTGTFNYGQVGQIFTIRVKDKLCTTAPPATIDVVVKDWSNAQNIIQGTSTLCPGGTIELSINLPDVTNVKWLAPNGYSRGGTQITIPNATRADSGYYTLTLTTSGGCEYTEKFLVSVTTPPAPIVSAIPDMCINTGTVNLANYVRVSNSSYSLVWYEQDRVTVRATAPIVESNKVGEFTYYVAQKDSRCQSNPLTPVKVRVNAVPAAIDPANMSVFVNPADQKPLITIRGVVGYTYNLYTDATGNNIVGTTGVSTGTSSQINPSKPLSLNTDYYIATVTDKSCVSETRTVVNTGDVFRLIEGPEKVCVNTDLILSLNKAIKNPLSITWTLPNGNSFGFVTLFQIPDVTEADAGRYTVKVETAEGGVLEDYIDVQVITTSKPVVNIANVAYCQNATASPLQATALANHTLRWYKNNVSLSETAPSPSTDVSGILTYQVSQVNDLLQCESERVDIKVEIYAQPQAVPVANLSSCISNVPNVVVANTIVGSKYSLYNAAVDGKLEASPVSGNGSNINLLGTTNLTESTTYYVQVTDKQGCQSKARTAVGLIVNSDLITGTPAVCEGGTIKFSAVSISGATYDWVRPNASTYSGNPLPNIVNAQKEDAGKYKLTISKESCSPVQASMDVKVGRPDTPGGVATFYFCHNSQASQLTAEVTSGYVLKWYSQEEGGVALFDAPIPQTKTVGTTYYYVSQANSNDLSCESYRRKIAVVVSALPAAVPDMSPINICAKSIPNITISVSDKSLVYLLYAESTGGTAISTAEGTGGSILLTSNNELVANTTYYIETKNRESGCKSLNRTAVNINVTNLYLKPETLPPFKRNESYSVFLQTNANNPLFSYTGAFPTMYFELDGSTGEISGMVPASGSAEARTFKIKVVDPNGCKEEREYTLKSELLVVQVFSPNGDGINDYFMKGYKVVIFDRKGVKLFEGYDGWDGRYNGRVMQPGTYFYVLQYTSDDGSEKKVSGHIMLLNR